MVIGLSFHTSPLEMRERLAIPEAEWPLAITQLCALNHIEEAAVLSTCNRIEIYVSALSRYRGVKEVTEWMSKVFFPFPFISFTSVLQSVANDYMIKCYFFAREVGFQFRISVSIGFCCTTKTPRNICFKSQLVWNLLS